jgi:hypothetical protein
MFVATVAWNNACLTVLRLTEPDAALAAYRMCTLPISLARRRFQGGALNENSSRDHTNHEALLVQWRNSTTTTYTGTPLTPRTFSVFASAWSNDQVLKFVGSFLSSKSNQKLLSQF